MVNASRKVDAQNKANADAKAKLLTRQANERKALQEKNIKMEGAIVRSQQDKLKQDINNHNKDFSRRMNDPNGKLVPVKDLPNVKNTMQMGKSVKQTNKLLKANKKVNAQETKALAKTQKAERKALNKKIKKNNTSIKKKTKSAIKKASTKAKETASKINKKANQAVKKVRKGKRG